MSEAGLKQIGLELHVIDGWCLTNKPSKKKSPATAS